MVGEARVGGDARQVALAEPLQRRAQPQPAAGRRVTETPTSARKTRERWCGETATSAGEVDQAERGVVRERLAGVGRDAAAGVLRRGSAGGDALAGRPRRGRW